jgi:hypothetical protein
MEMTCQSLQFWRKLPYPVGVKRWSAVLFVASAAALFALCVIAIGCASEPNFESAKEVTATQLKAFLCGPEGRYSTMFRGVSYAGSDDNFHYIAVTIGDGRLRKYKVFKVKAGELGLDHHMPVKSAPTDWIDTYAQFSVDSCH